MKQVEIAGRSVTIRKFGAIEGWKLLHKVSSIIGPSIALAGEEKLEAAFSSFFEKCDENELIALLKRLTGQCEIDGREIKDFNTDLADYAFVIQLVMAVFEENFGEFFLSTKGQVSALMPDKQAKGKKRRR